MVAAHEQGPFEHKRYTAVQQRQRPGQTNRIPREPLRQRQQRFNYTPCSKDSAQVKLKLTGSPESRQRQQRFNCMIYDEKDMTKLARRFACTRTSAACSVVTKAPARGRAPPLRLTAADSSADCGGEGPRTQ